MSKRLKNYPDPLDVVHRHGADALRLYLINSPVVRAAELKFKEDGVEKVTKSVFIPWYNSYRFLIQCIERLQGETGKDFIPTSDRAATSTNSMDRWIEASLQSLVKYVRQEMEAYHLYTVVPSLVDFIDKLTNWYVRLNRPRLKGAEGLQRLRSPCAPSMTSCLRCQSCGSIHSVLCGVRLSEPAQDWTCPCRSCCRRA